MGFGGYANGLLNITDLKLFKIQLKILKNKNHF